MWVKMGVGMGCGGVYQSGGGDGRVGFDHLGKAPPRGETKKVHKNQFWGTSAYSFRQGSVTWFLGSGDAGGDNTKYPHGYEIIRMAVIKPQRMQQK